METVDFKSGLLMRLLARDHTVETCMRLRAKLFNTGHDYLTWAQTVQPGMTI